MTTREAVKGYIVQIEIEPDDDEYHAFAPELPGLHVGGDTIQEALARAHNATEVYIASCEKHGDPILLHAATCTVWNLVLGTVPSGHWRCDCGLASPSPAKP